MALYDTGDDITVTAAPELTSPSAPNWTICTRRPACSVQQSAARIRRSVRSRSSISVALRDDRWPRLSREIRRYGRLVVSW